MTNFLQTHWRELLSLTAQHLWLVLVSISVAVLIGIPVGILLTRHARWKRPVLGVAGILQTVPSLALFGFLIPLPLVGGIGARTAIFALVVYALLPVIRNTVTGIEGVDANVREAAVAMGMTSRQILWQVELPLATTVILAGVRVAAVISVGVATIAAAIGAGGLGTYIFRGLRMNDNRLVLAGAIPAAAMALAADWLIGLLETRLSPQARTRATAETKRRTTVRRVAVASLIVVLIAAGYAVWRSGAKSPTMNSSGAQARVSVGSKDFTESVILAEMLAQALEARGLAVERRFELGGNLCHDALVAGQIDVYPEYTGTSFTAILKHQPITDPRAVYEQVKREYTERFAVETSPPLGFSNDFAILVRGRDARELKLRTISDAAVHAPRWRAGFGQDFMSRPDGYEGFARAYDLRFASRPREMDLSLTYRALAAGEVDIIAGNSTDGLISALDLVQLTDDRHYFPPYEAVFLARRDALARATALNEVLQKLGGAISTEEMRRLNYEVDGGKRAPAEVVREWRERKGL
ncbi:MAG: osmoprotectant transport system substrate-binding protein opuBD [Acidobacteriota bacterium]|nr:osmoprotectant transport system substrate-binding protein opuBD [Acidobacteriota bacterium]